MTNKLPITLLAQFGEVAVFQTAAFESTDCDLAEQKNKQMRELGQASYGELNLGLHVNDDAAQVLTNRMRLLTAINEQLATQQRLPITRLHWVNQVHGKQVYDVDTTSLSMQPADADAMISQQTDLGLAIMTADCVPIVLYQPATGQIAAIHAGWQGLACGVIKATAECFGAAGQIIAWIGVCISQAHYEVGNHVRDQLLAGCVENQSLTSSSIDNFDQLFCATKHTTVGTDKIKLNLPKLATDQLVAAGITVATDLPVCCSYNAAHYYSYRRQTHLQQPATGRMALIIVRSASMNNPA